MAEANPDDLLDDVSRHSVHSISSHVNHQYLEDCTEQRIPPCLSVSPISPEPVSPTLQRPLPGRLTQALRGVYKHGNRLDLCGVALKVEPELKVLPPLVQESTTEVHAFSVEQMEAFTHCCSIVDMGVESSKEYAGLGDCSHSVNPVTDFYHYSVHKTVHTCRCRLEKEQLKLSSSLISELSNLSNDDDDYNQIECERIFKEYGSHVYIGDISFGGIYSCEACYSGQVKDASIKLQSVADFMSDMIFRPARQLSKHSEITTCSLKTKGGSWFAPSFNLWKTGLDSNRDSWVLVDRGSEAVGIWEILLNHESEIHNVTHLSQVLFRAWERSNSASSIRPQALCLDRHSPGQPRIKHDKVVSSIDTLMTRVCDDEGPPVTVCDAMEAKEATTALHTTGEFTTPSQNPSLQDQDNFSNVVQDSADGDHCIVQDSADGDHCIVQDSADGDHCIVQDSADGDHCIVQDSADGDHCIVQDSADGDHCIVQDSADGDHYIVQDSADGDHCIVQDSADGDHCIREHTQFKHLKSDTEDVHFENVLMQGSFDSTNTAKDNIPINGNTEQLQVGNSITQPDCISPDEVDYHGIAEDSSITDAENDDLSEILQNCQLSEDRLGLLEHLQLTEYYPEKISIQDVMQLSDRKSEQDKSIGDVPWNILRGLIMLDREAISEMGSEDFLEEDGQLNPLDIFLATFVCCDLILRQTLVEKMSICRLAIPFISPSSGYQDLTYNLWSWRNTILDWCDASQISTEASCVACPLKVVSCLRLGQPSQSKSILLNYLISNNIHSTFLNRESLNGDNQKIFANGLVEGSFYLPDGKQGEEQKTSLEDVTLFLNLRGDGREHQKQVNVLSKISNVVLALLDISELGSDTILQQLEVIKQKCNKTVMIISGGHRLPEDEVKRLLDDFEHKVGSPLEEKSRIVQAFKRKRVKNASLLKSEILKEIKEIIQGDQHSILQDLSQMMIQESIHVDEMDRHCQEGKILADEIMSSFAKSTKGKRKSDLLPLQGTNWQEWCRLLKKKKRPQSRHESSTLKAVGRTETEMQTHRNKQASLSNNPFIQTFIKGLSASLNSPSMDYYILWVKLGLNEVCRQELPPLKRLRDERFHALKTAKDARNRNTEMLEKEILDIELQIANTEVGIEHLMRELGQLYEASETSTYSIPKVPSLGNIPLLAATLLLKGHALEIMDGDASGVPLIWLDAVFAELEKILGNQKLSSVSVLGIQSSGKSTLLNTMFGFQFPVSAGRCTRGIYMQLVKVNDFPFDYMAIMNSEGLRAPELTSSMFDHNNELETFLIGLGNMTVINIKGEVAVEVKEILQNVCHALLRMMIVNEGIQKERSSVFVHQNVTTVNAREKMSDAAQKFEKALDDMTVEAAYLENLVNIQSFNQIIKFDRQKHIWYFPDLWYGNPPMASVNTLYHKSVSRLKTSILNHQARERKGYYSFTEMKDFIKDMWNGVLAENFVFGFRSSQVTKAHNQLDDKFSELKWELEVAVNDWLEKVQLEVDETKESLQCHCAKLKREAVDYIHQKQEASILALDCFIENDSQNQIMKSWQQQKKHGLNCVAEAQCLKVKNDIDQKRAEHEDKTFRNKKQDLHKQEILRKAQQLAEKVEKTQDEETLTSEFEKMWNDSIGNVHLEQSTVGTIEHTLAELLDEHLKNNSAVLHQQLADNPLNQIPSLVGSINMHDLSMNDLGLGSWHRALSKGQIDQIKKRAVSEIDAIFTEVNLCVTQVSERLHLQNAEEALDILQRLIKTVNSNPNHQFCIGTRLEVYLALHVVRHLLRYRLIPPALKTDILELVIQLYPACDPEDLAEKLQQCDLEGSIRETQIHESEMAFVSQAVYTSVGKRQFKELKKHAIFQINGIFRKVDSYSRYILKRYSTFQAYDAGEILKAVQGELQKFNNSPNELFKIPKNLEVRLLVHVSRYCLQMFLEIQDQHEKRHSVAAQLQDYKNTSWNLFLNLVKESGKGVTAAAMLCDELKPLIKNHVRDSIQTAIVKEVVPHFFRKKKLIQVILQDLAQRESFSAYQGYLHDTEMFVFNWLLEYTDSFIFNERFGSCWYMDQIKLFLNRLFTNIEKVVAEMSQIESSQNSIGTWIACFSIALHRMPEQITFTSTIPEDIDDYVVENFQTSIAIPVLKGLQKAKDELLEGFRKDRSYTTKQGKKIPYSLIYTTLWGCDATCPFCEEPCINPEPGHVSYEVCHECIQHRPRGIMHWTNDRTKQLIIESCNYDVQGNRQFLCRGTIHECTRTKEEADRTYHAFKSYKKYMPQWHIPPSADMSSSNYWKWFFTKYNRQIAEAANGNESDIPRSWYNITKKKAIESLFEYDEYTPLIRAPPVVRSPRLQPMPNPASGFPPSPSLRHLPPRLPPRQY